MPAVSESTFAAATCRRRSPDVGTCWLLSARPSARGRPKRRGANGTGKVKTRLLRTSVQDERVARRSQRNAGCHEAFKVLDAFWGCSVQHEVFWLARWGP